MTPAEIEALLAATQVEHTDDLCRAEWEWIVKAKEAAEFLLERLELAKRLIAASEAALTEADKVVVLRSITGYPPSDASLAIYDEWQRQRDEWNATEEP